MRFVDVFESRSIAEQQTDEEFNKREHEVRDELDSALNLYDALDEMEVRVRLDRVRRA